MVNRTIRLSKALWLETLKRLPYIIALAIALAAVGGVQSYRKTAEGVNVAKDNTTIIRQQSKDIAVLIRQNKDLTKQNNELAHKNATQLNCIAEIFVDFINNGGQPSHMDIESCQSVLVPVTNNSSPSTAAEPSNTKGNANIPTRSNQTKKPTSAPQKPVRKVLGVSACLPFTEVCAR